MEVIINGTAALCSIVEVPIKNLFEKDNKDKRNEKEALEQYIIPMKKHFDSWESILVEEGKAVTLTDYDLVKAFISVYIDNDKFQEIRQRAYLLPGELDISMEGLFQDLDNYIQKGALVLNRREDDLVMLSTIRAIEVILEEGIKTLGREF